MRKEDWLTTFIHELVRLRPEFPRREAHRVGLALYGDGNTVPTVVARLFADEWDGWIMSFVEELQRLRPTVNPKLAKTIGAVWQAREAHSDPKKAAQSYVKGQHRRRHVESA